MLLVVSPAFDLLTCDVKSFSPLVILFAFKGCKRNELEVAISSVAEEVCTTLFSVVNTGKSNVAIKDTLVTMWLGSDAMA